MRETDRKGDERNVTGTRRHQATEAAREDETMRNDERMKGDSRGGQRYMIANRETMGGLINYMYKCKLIGVFLFYKLIYCRYKPSKMQVLNLSFDILFK